MNYGYIAAKIAAILVAIATSVFLGLKVRRILGRIEDAEEYTKKRIENSLKKNQKMNSMQGWMSKYGVLYRFRDYNLSPATYILGKVGFGICFGLLLYISTDSLLLGFSIGFGSFFLVDIVFKQLNESDNKNFLMDLCTVYSNITIQMGMGIYIGECIEYSCTMVQNKRFKEALEEFVTNLSDKTILTTEAIHIFESRFCSKNIKSLCTMLESFVLYGNNATYSKMIQRETEDLIQTSATNSETLMENKVMMVTFLLFVMITLIIAYIFMSNLKDVSSIF